MNIQAFIPDWKGIHANPWMLQNHLEPFCEVTILESYDVPFSIQWEEAVSKFDGDVFLWTMADARLNPNYRYQDLFPAMVGAYYRGDVGMYAPNLDYTAMVYDTSKLRQVEPGLYEVAGTDLVFASIHRDLLAALPPLGCNTHAWSYDYLIASIATKMGKKVVRDYNFLIDHPYSKAYSEPEAIGQQDAWIQGLSWEHQEGIREQQKIKVRTGA